ncbi:MAG: hypothetical protein ABIP94_01930 [Planctomycetota bacterium]
MPQHRLFVVLAAAVFATRAVRAQQVEIVLELIRTETSRFDGKVIYAPKAAAEVRCTLWVAYPSGPRDLADHSMYLTDLQTRFGAKGVAVGVMLPPAAAKALAAKEPGFQVAAIQGDAALPPGHMSEGTARIVSSWLCRGENGETLASWNGVDGAVDLLQQFLDDKAGGALAADFDSAVAMLLAQVGDGGDFDDLSAHCKKTWPHSGRAHAAAVLCQWWCKGDLEAARQAIDDAIKALGNEAVPMTVFADLVLRGDRSDPDIARTISVAMAPAAATAPEGVFTQLVYLRALLRAGQDRLAGRVAATLQKRLEGRPEDLLIFAETLMEGSTPAAFRDLAERAIEAATAAGQNRWSYAARHKVLARCGDKEAAEKLMTDYRGSDAGAGDLNNDAWYLIVRPETMGRFDTLALAQCEELARQFGAQLSYGNKDTVALAYFVNGQVEKAVELQTEATKASNQQPTYVGRLTRFRAVLAERARKQEADKK